MSSSNLGLCLLPLLLPLLLAAAPVVVANRPQPIALHPDNPHYFLWNGKPTLLITSGEHYGAVLNLDFDYVPYLDELKSHGLNLTRTFSGVYLENGESFGITDNTLAPRPGRSICPWARSDVPGAAQGGNKFDLTRWDAAYFRRLRDFVRQAQERGIVVELTLFCIFYGDDVWHISPLNAANNVNGIGTCPASEVHTLKHADLLDIQIALTRKIVAELAEFDNLYYEICNEPYVGGVSEEWQRRIVDEIVGAEKGLPARHLISMNIASGHERVERPHPAVSIYNFHYCVPPDAVTLNYGLNKVIGENETGFRGSGDVLYRTEAWDFLIAGGALYNNLDYSFSTQHPDGTLTNFRSPGGGGRALRKQLGVLKRFLDGFDFTRMKPDNSVIVRVVPELNAGALVEAGEAYAVYLHIPLPNKPEDLKNHLRDNIAATLTLKLPAADYKAVWVDTKTGVKEKEEVFDHHGGDKQLISPPFSNDIALRVQRLKQKSP